MDNPQLTEEQKRILDLVRKTLDELFPHKLHWPICYIHKTEMCEVNEDGNTKYVCLEKDCGHTEYSI